MRSVIQTLKSLHGVMVYNNRSIHQVEREETICIICVVQTRLQNETLRSSAFTLHGSINMNSCEITQPVLTSSLIAKI